MAPADCTAGHGADEGCVSEDVRTRILWQCFWLAGALTACKAALLGVPNPMTLAGGVDYLHDLAVMSHQDVLFALSLAVATQTAGRLRLGRWAGERVFQRVLLSLAVVSVIYGIASVQVFAYLRTPLTYPLMYLAGDMKNMRSSLGAFVTPALLVALLLGPAAFLLLAAASRRLIRLPRTRWDRIGRPAGVAAVLLYVAWAHHAYSSPPWCDRVDRRVAENPHWVLMKSFLTDLTSAGERIQLDEEFPPGHLHDFAIITDRTRVRSDRIHAGGVETSAPTRLPPPDESGHDEPADGGDLTLTDAGVKRPKNVIVYVLESVGSQYLSLYGSPYATTPRLEAEAAYSLVFDNFYAHCGVTANSLVAINLGIYPGMTWREYTVEQPNLPGTTVAELVKERGYRTAYITSGEIEYVNMDGFLRGRGYDDVWGYSRLPCKELIISWGVEDRCLVDGALSWIDREPDEPFYLMIWTQQTHHPYEPSPSVPFVDFFQGLPKDQLPPDDYDLCRYLNVVREADRQLGRLFDGLRQRGLADDTLVVVTGDHGEGFGSPHDIYGHGGKVFDEIVRVPLVLWNPRLFGTGKKGSGVFDRNAHQRLPTASCRRVDTIGGHIDLNPTLAEMLELPAAGSWQGRSLFSPDRPPRVYFYAANDDYLLGVREHNQKYIYNAAIGREQLFDLAADPHEQINLAHDDADRCRELRSRVAAWIEYEKGHISRLREQTPTRRVVAAGVVHGAER